MTPVSFYDLISCYLKGDVPAPVELHAFLHIRKAAGNSVARSLASHFTPSEVFRHDGLPAIVPDRMLPDPAQFVWGHFPLSDPMLKTTDRRTVTVSVLREPVARMISLYRFSGAEPTNQFYEMISSGRLDIVSFAKLWSQSGEYQFSYFTTEVDGFRRDPESALKALANDVTLFGFLDALEEFSAMCVLLCGFYKMPDHIAANTTDGVFKARQTSEIPHPSEGEVLQLKEILQIDVEFYHRAKEIYQTRKNILVKALGGDDVLTEIMRLNSEISERQRRLTSLSLPRLTKDVVVNKSVAL